MSNNADEMIVSLTPEIQKKCSELQEAQRERLHTKIFVLLCAAVILIPTLFVLLGFSLRGFIIPVVFASITLIILSPILISQQGGMNYEKI